jgi:hypothetical protein
MDLPDKSRPEQPKKVIKRVVPVGAAQTSSRPASRRFFNFVFAESPRNLLGNVASNILVPRAKAGVEEALNSFLAGMLWGDSGNRPMSNIVRGTVLSGSSSRGMNYAALSAPGTPAVPATVKEATGPYQDIVVGTQEYASDILANAYDLLNQYRVVAVGDLYESAGITPAPHHNSYGWYSLDGARITKQRDGFLIELPRPVHL